MDILMEAIFTVFAALFLWGCLDYVMRQFKIWRQGEQPNLPYYGPTINDHERRLREEISKFSEHRTALVQKNKTEYFDHFTVHGAFIDRDIDLPDYLNDPMYSYMPGNINYTDDSQTHGNDHF